MISADKDLWRLVADARHGIVMWDGKRKLSTVRAIREEWGIEPGRVGDLLALTGDEGDGIPGVRGNGPKRAAEMLRGSLRAWRLRFEGLRG